MHQIAQNKEREVEKHCGGLLRALSGVPEWIGKKKKAILLNVKAIFVIIRCCAQTV